ncbi:hypothetical protein ERJ70_16120 [Sediminibacillus dalangtanensis]|uniref:Uncharacterized protein n=1 Tax=Sediminibacillus dalangtanensis TaxID=2729421 RepID=A0ABX7VVF9_9BACI|nr:hypothetical protein ERJ70_16120 [Sediminibacillus dalangtanensis]
MKQKFKWGCLIWLGIFGAGILVLAILFIGPETVFGYSYLFALLVRIVLTMYLPWLTLPAAVISLILSKNTKRAIIAIGVCILVEVLDNYVQSGRGPGSGEYLLWLVDDGTILDYLWVIGYLYLVYWWIIVVKRKKKREENNESRR